MQENYVYNELNKSWKEICKVILEDEIGELKDYEKLLLENIEKSVVKKSEKTGKEVF